MKNIIDYDDLPSMEFLISSLNEKFGDNAVFKGFPHDENDYQSIKRISTGSISLDIALGGGIPKGLYTEISDGLSTIKTSLVLNIIREAQNMGLVCALLDIEGTVTKDFAKIIGVDLDSLIYSRPSNMEEVFQLILDLQKSGIVHLGVIDSISDISVELKNENNIDEKNFFRKYQMANNELWRKGKEQFTLVCTNQFREKTTPYKFPEDRNRGFASAVDLRLRKSDSISWGKGDKKEVVGYAISFKIEKNKTYRRVQPGQFDYYHLPNGVGVTPYHIDIHKDIVICAIQQNIITTRGSWFIYNGQKYQGMQPLIDYLRNNIDLFQELKDKIICSIK